jgi:hypothetical protein
MGLGGACGAALGIPAVGIRQTSARALDASCCPETISITLIVECGLSRHGIRVRKAPIRIEDVLT